MTVLAWETVVPLENYQYTERLKVFGGWVLRCHDGVKDTIAMCFIPDANFDWTLPPAE